MCLYFCCYIKALTFIKQTLLYSFCILWTVHRNQVRFMFFAVWPTCWPHPSAASLLSSLCAPLIGSPSASVKAGVGGTQTIHSCSLRCGRNATADQDPGRQQSGRGSIHSVHRRTRLCRTVNRTSAHPDYCLFRRIPSLFPKASQSAGPWSPLQDTHLASLPG